MTPEQKRAQAEAVALLALAEMDAMKQVGLDETTAWVEVRNAMVLKAPVGYIETTSQQDNKTAGERATDAPESQQDSRTAGEAAKSAASNTSEALAEIARGLSALFGNDGSKLSSGLTFDKDSYEKAKPFFISGTQRLGAAGKDIAQMMHLRNSQPSQIPRREPRRRGF
ncbi:hypothetical protein [Candidatus Halocynthiibacter alkanivorans]|uniref:hypothetical protein n=1 Tax=Candidatus Halocynthiibacter alkanivorans TaxID=2267619 RepID=UPI000DF1475D|nr:hypothetical protein [Candidatus Halocynthiibacter alkanivorans]